MSDNRNLLIAIALCAAVILGWEYFVAVPQMNAQKAAQAQTTVAQQEKHQSLAPAKAPTTSEGAAHLSRAQALKLGGTRIVINTPAVDGSLRLKGARFDDLRLKHYRETTDPKSPEIILLSPTSTSYPYYAEFGWVAAQSAHVAVPTDSTVWQQAGNGMLSPGHPVTLQWDNGHGLIFKRTIAVDDQYMFTVSDAVTNKTSATASLFPYANVVRDGLPDTQHYWAVHEGFVGVADGTLKDSKYTDFKPDTPPENFHSTGGWLGITDKYWMAAAIPPQKSTLDGAYRTAMVGGVQAYQADYRMSVSTVAPGQTVTVTQHLFAGAKVVSIIQAYEDKLGIDRFDLAIDWGWFFFFTKPIFLLLDFFYRHVGNFGIAILLLTLTIKIIFFPIANTSYKSMSKMKKLQPEMERIKARFADDKVRQQQETMELYKREKVNPVSGCLPMLLQIPVFFSLYKVIFVTIEMRQAPFFGWIHDLSAPDPTTIVNLFGLLPFTPPDFLPAFLHVGAWACMMGATQWFQTKLNPAPADPAQAKMFAFMPLIMVFMLAGFPAGLVIYWTWNNLLTVLQQYTMMRRQGVSVNFIENMKMPAWLTALKPKTKLPAEEPRE
ncbi:MAG TPA: membrane protein insertase YidC [Rhizomicrobium sp.]|jgi:YidC/Oxa1 family membrane protein insertase|nr:membrane protein insertase YidC [Rhizomicrobium sp.]